MENGKDEKVVSLHGEPCHFSHLQPSQLFTVEQVVSPAPLDEFSELVLCGRTRDGRLYVASTHSTAVSMLLLANAQHFMAARYEVY